MILSGQNENPLTQAFTNFHRALKSAVDIAQIDHPLTAITFSDSAYIATNHLYEAVNIASYFVQTLVSQRIPVRTGIAYGTFATVRFRSDVTPLEVATTLHSVEYSPEERNNSFHVRYEIDYWRFKPTAESKAWHSLQDMWDSAPQGELVHYEATAQAINRMRMSQGEAPLKNFRRRTLPHTRK